MQIEVTISVYQVETAITDKYVEKVSTEELLYFWPPHFTRGVSTSAVTTFSFRPV